MPLPTRRKYLKFLESENFCYFLLPCLLKHKITNTETDKLIYEFFSASLTHTNIEV